MPRRRTRENRPMEWVNETFVDATADRTTVSITRTIIDLDLLPDEIAEIHGVEETLFMDWTGETDSRATMGSALSMDPNNIMGDWLSATAATMAAAFEDLEVFYQHQLNLELLLTTSGIGVVQPESHRSFWPSSPILVGTNIGWNMQVSEDVAGAAGTFQAWIQVYFRRRRATASELNQVILKRR